MLIFFLVIFLVIISVIIIFAFPQFSPIPYFPSNAKDLPLIINALAIKNNQSVIDLGAGDGIIIFKAAEEALKKNLNTQFIAVDINPILIWIMNIRRLFNRNRKNIRIIWGDFFKIDINNFLVRTAQRAVPTFYLYISPWLLEKALEKIKKYDGRKTIVSYFYPIKSLKETKKIQGIHSVYLYKI